MKMASAYWQNKIRDFQDESRPIFICSCGTYHLFTKKKFTTYRPYGRLDYQIIYVASGKAHFHFNGVTQIITAGNMVIYRPKEEQCYYYYGTDHTEVYWLHFTGSDIPNTLCKYGIHDDVHVLHTGTSLEYKRIFLAIIQELKLCKDDYEELLVNYFQHLLILVHRAMNSKPRGQNYILMQEMDLAVRYFNENYNKTISIEEYAAKHHMSVSWFIRNFKEYTESTPAQYILSLRISNAQTLLQTSNYNVTEIASIVGYDNPLYFSRLFKKQNGISPSEFRKQFSNE